MGTVYLAQDTLIGRLVAIKSFNIADSLDGRQLRELRQASVAEAQAAGILSHPNIVTIHDVVEGADGSLPLIAMEYVRGSNLREVLQGGNPLPKDFVLSVVSQVASALDYAHEMGVFHGDVKPANILITEDEQAKLTDFGVARLERGGTREAKKFLGTPKYVAPEQVLRKEVDHRADIFALGVVVFEMLCGRPPFDGKTTAEIIHRVAHEAFELPPDPERQPAPEVLRVLEKALHKEPRRRYQQARELATDLRHAVSPESSASDSAETQDLSGHLPEPDPQVTPSPENAKPAAALRRGGRVSWRRILTACLALSLAIIGWFGGSLWLILPFRPIESPVSPAEHRQRRQAFPLLQEAARLLRRGQPAAAAEVLERAESLAPSVAAAARLRQRAEREAEELEGYRELEEEIQSLVLAARAALASGRPEEAQRAADRVLDLDPERVEARLLLARAQSPPAPIRQAAPPRSARAPDPPTPAQVETTHRRASRATEPKPKPGPRLPATLRVDFFSHLSKGVLTIYSGNQQILLQPFRFVKKSGLLRRKGVSGRLERDIELPPGRTTLRIFVASQGRKTQATTLALTLEGGKTQVLRIAVSKSGATRVDLS